MELKSLDYRQNLGEFSGQRFYRNSDRIVMNVLKYKEKKCAHANKYLKIRLFLQQYIMPKSCGYIPNCSNKKG